MNYPPIPFCCYCGKVIQHPLQDTAEHLIPKSHGGNNLPRNKRRCCGNCNNWRGSKTLTEFKTDVEKHIKANKIRKSYSAYDYQIMIENIDYIAVYVESAGEKLLK